MVHTQTSSRAPETITPMDTSDEHDDTEDLAWARFWLGIACVITFVIVTVLLVAATHGAHAAADYGLLVLILALIAGIVDAAVLVRRRNRRRNRNR